MADVSPANTPAFASGAIHELSEELRRVERRALELQWAIAKHRNEGASQRRETTADKELWRVLSADVARELPVADVTAEYAAALRAVQAVVAGELAAARMRSFDAGRVDVPPANPPSGSRPVRAQILCSPESLTVTLELPYEDYVRAKRKSLDMRPMDFVKELLIEEVRRVAPAFAPWLAACANRVDRDA